MNEQVDDDEHGSAGLSQTLRELATAYGVATDFWDWQGRHTEVPRATVVAVLAALDVPAGTEQEARQALEDVRVAPWRRTLPPVVVTRSGATTDLPVHVPHGDPVRAWVELETGGTVDLLQTDRWVDPQVVDGRLTGEATFRVPADLPLGWHEVCALPGDDGGDADAAAGRVVRAPLVVTPDQLPPPLPGRGPAWGFMTQLYAVRSRRSWGHGDLDDLAELARWSAEEHGADFVLVNPLHAPAPVPPIEPSPYLPVTRRFVSPLYVRVELVPEYAYLPAGARADIERLALSQRSVNAADLLIDRDAVWEAKSAALRQVHAVPRSPAREADYRAFLAREGQGLRDFATWCALAEVHGPVWSQWPEPLRDPSAPSVAEAREELADRVDFYGWLQWVLDEQLAAAQRRAVAAGMALGVIHDLAVGVHPEGADTWALQRVMASGVTVGAPPDAFNQLGQDWSQPPWRPDRLSAAGYLPYRDMLRTILRHCGGIRVDHILGLFRLWWVPEGRPAAEGTYVRYDHDALVGILALEAARSGALVIGEDLGTVEPWVRTYLADRGILGTSILWFERDDGRPRPPETWRELCLAAVTTHDLPPTAGYLAGEHIRLRHRLGLLTRSVEEEESVDRADQASWLQLLIDRGWLTAEEAAQSADGDNEPVILALHRALAATPSVLRGVALTDAVGDRRTMNQPGTHAEYPNWRLPLTDSRGVPVLLEDLVRSPRAGRLADIVATRPR